MTPDGNWRRDCSTKLAGDGPDINANHGLPVVASTYMETRWGTPKDAP